MKRIFFSGIIFMSFSVISCCFGADETVTSPGKPLTVEEFIGTDDAYLEPTIFPNFYRDVSKENPTCADYLMEGDTDPDSTRNNGTAKDRWTDTYAYGKSWSANKYPYRCVPGNNCDKSSVKLPSGDNNYSNCAKSKRYCDSGGVCQNAYKPCKEEGYNSNGSPKESDDDLHKGEYQGIPGLTGTIKPAKGYRNITKILFTWTVRVEGWQRLVAVWPFICHPHHGTSYQEFPEGLLRTQLYVKDVNNTYTITDKTDPDYVYNPEDGYYPVGQIAEMTVPEAGTSKVKNIGDPTITGSFALLPSDFADGKIPKAGVEFQVRWYNKTSMRIKSPANQRNLIATVFPVTSQESEE